jgi:hypothetical protein
MKERAPGFVGRESDSDGGAAHAVAHLVGLFLGVVVEAAEVERAVDGQVGQFRIEGDASKGGLTFGIWDGDREIAIGAFSAGEGENVGCLVESAEFAVEASDPVIVGEEDDDLGLRDAFGIQRGGDTSAQRSGNETVIRLVHEAYPVLTGRFHRVGNRPELSDRLPKCGSLAAAAAAALQTASLFAGLFVMAVLFELAKNAALLELHVEALESAVDRFVGLDGDVYQS